MTAQARAAVETMGIIRSRKQDQGATGKRGKAAPPGGARPALQSTPAVLRPDFAKVQEQFESLLQAFTLGKFDQTEFTTRLSSLRLTTEDGADWTIGVRTRLWYRREAGESKWDVRQPPTVDSALPGAIEVTSFDEELQRALAEPAPEASEPPVPAEIVITTPVAEEHSAPSGDAPDWEALDALLADEEAPTSGESSEDEEHHGDHLAAVEMLHASGGEVEEPESAGGYGDLDDEEASDSATSDSATSDSVEALDEPTAAFELPGYGEEDAGAGADGSVTEDDLLAALEEGGAGEVAHGDSPVGEADEYDDLSSLGDLDELDDAPGAPAEAEPQSAESYDDLLAELDAHDEEPQAAESPAAAPQAESRVPTSSPEGEDPLGEALDALAALISRMNSASRS